MTTLAANPATDHGAGTRRRIALPGQLCRVTVCTADRQRSFADAAVARAACEILTDPRTWPGAHPLVWVLMPNHWHGLIRLSGVESLSTVVSRAKAAVRRPPPARTDEPLWRPSFHDHALRSGESVIDVCRHVLANPVRAALVPHWSDWRWRGGEWLVAFEAELPWRGRGNPTEMPLRADVPAISPQTPGKWLKRDAIKAAAGSAPTAIAR